VGQERVVSALIEHLMESRADEIAKRFERGEIERVDGATIMPINYAEVAAKTGATPEEAEEATKKLVEGDLLQVLLWPHETTTDTGAFVKTTPRSAS
jgi:hypothetical protein